MPVKTVFITLLYMTAMGFRLENVLYNAIKGHEVDQHLEYSSNKEW